MALRADDFGCVPDGRLLERASMTAGSAALTALDGTLRPADVGKNIAVAGAIDLRATVAGLVDRREVREAAMSAEGPTPRRLTGTLIDPAKPAGANRESFLQYVEAINAGRPPRITVAGAGPGGSILVSDVARVIDATTIELAAPAATTVVAGANAAVILNQADRVALSNYARRAVSQVTVDLGDRVVTDGSMPLAGRSLASATAKFSSLDLEKSVAIRDAGLLVTTIQAVTADSRAILAQPAQRAVDGARADIWETDSRPGLENLLAGLQHLDVESAEIQFGPGVYDFTRSPNPSTTLNAAIELLDRRNLTFRGAGAGVTILRLMPNQDLGVRDTHVVEARRCRNITFRDLTAHGAFMTMGNANEQMHGIRINQGCEDIAISHCTLQECFGDGAGLLGAATGDGNVRRVRIAHCLFQGNKRSGLGVQRALEQILVAHCTFDATLSDQSIDFEPSGQDAPTGLIIDGCLIRHTNRSPAVTLSGIRGTDPTGRVVFSNNVVLGGPVFCTDIREVIIQNNVIVVPDLGHGRIPLQVQRGGEALLLTGNLLVNEDPLTEAALSLSEVNQRPVRRALVAHNLCRTVAGRGIQVLSSDDVAVDGNTVVASGAAAQGILVRAEASGVDGVAVRGNEITVEEAGAWQTGISVAAPQPVGELAIVANGVRGAAEGIRFAGAGFTRTPVCALNRLDAGVAAPLVGLASLPEDALVVGGAVSRGGAAPGGGGGRTLAGLGAPDGRVAGHPGDLYQRLDGGPGATLYVKEAGDGTTGGWAAK